MNNIIPILILISFLGCEKEPKNKTEPTKTFEFLNAITKNPNQYENTEVWVKGKLNMGFENNSISSDNSKIWLRYPDVLITKENISKCQDSFAFIKGWFTEKQKGHLGLYNGTISRIFYLKCGKEVVYSQED